ncbi:aspartyl protease DI49_0336 [Saccharomyces eubayanus]|uniref:aspartyl protease n=1 Tax=Saccharomyces eubayanus TaxID=1080349 RepID=UPI0006C098C5|nr:hypothetical protein DI49_0336 [Saccharomyces eubayanus]KOH00990.1 hypothetical protein DI49_0336 [Saccharomyces eubayanus]
MKFSAVTFATNAFLFYSSMVSADSLASSSLTAGDNYVKISFQKKYGDSFEDASNDKKTEAHLMKRGDDYEVVGLNNKENFYSVDLHIGTPSQKITVLVDTGSSDLWVTGSNNPYCSTDSGDTSDYSVEQKDSLESEIQSMVQSVVQSVVTEISYDTTVPDTDATATQDSTSSALQTIDCTEYGTFDSSNSSTFQSNKTDFSITYGDLTFASGTWGRDQLNLNNLNVTGLSFAVANETNSTVGVLGIGLPGLESTYSGATLSSAQESYTYNNFPMVLKNSGAIKSTAYSLFLNETNAKHGSILFGAVDHGKYSGDLYTIPIINTLQHQGYKDPIQFQVTLQGIGLAKEDTNAESTTLTTTKVPALLDSGTTISYMPFELVEMFADKVGASYSSEIGYYLMDCITDTDNDINVVFDFGGFYISGNLSSYQLSADSSSDICILGFAPQSDSTVILGDNFLSHAYVVYDLDNMEISMAQVDLSGRDENIDIIEDSVPSAVKAPSYSNTWSMDESIVSGGNIFTITSGSSIHSSGSGTYSTASTSSSKGQKDQTSTAYSKSGVGSAASSTVASSSTSNSSTKKENFGYSLNTPFFAKFITAVLSYI